MTSAPDGGAATFQRLNAQRLGDGTPLPPRAGIGLGTNLGDRLANLREARTLIASLPGVIDSPAGLLSAPLFETKPVDCEPGAGLFLNTVIEIEWGGTARALFEALQRIEHQLGRPADHARNVSRAIDLDLLYLDNLVGEEAGLTLPHPRMHERLFVLAPLAAIRPDFCLPDHPDITIAKLLRGVLAESPSGAVAPFLTGW